MDTIKSKSQR